MAEKLAAAQEDGVQLDPSELALDPYKDETYLDTLCRLKSSVVTNLVVAFLFITVIRQIMLRKPGISRR
jgi:hypothetical protein